ncbi:MAG TPA: TAT-variant-translocated molybdopterin oxidoreductase [Vicinamibacterales bacterium]|jgi:molybdopterin-containing oxidoreductase family iron-sulfur binding subunit
MTVPHDIQTLRSKLEGTRGRDYWRSLESVSETPEFKEFLHREFPQNASEWLDPVGRRSFLKLMSASLALAGVSACTRQPDEAIVPYVRQPEEIVPGKPLFFATAMPFAGAGVGLLVESHEGRPTKIEGNPDHPSSLGATDLFAQAAILGLYDPDRSQTLTQLGEIRSFDAFASAMRDVLKVQEASQGAGLRILTETVASPTLGAQLDELLMRFPKAKWVQWEPFGRHNEREGSRLAFGEYVDARYEIEKADVILSLDADFMCAGNGGLKHARAFASRRRIEGNRAQRNRLYAVESTPTNSGTKADHRLPLRANDVEAFARAVAAQLGVANAGAGVMPEAAQKWIAPLVKDLQAARGRSLVIAGESQSPALHALAHAMNAALGNVGTTVVYAETAELRPMDQRAGLKELVGEMNAGTVTMLVILGGNPVYTAPADLKFGDALGKVGLRVHLGLYHDETGALSHWHIPETHFLEMWSDVRADDGTVTIVQPLIAPLYGGRSAHEVLSACNDAGPRSSYDIVRSFWSARANVTPSVAPTPAGTTSAPTNRPTTSTTVAGPPTGPVPALSPFDHEWRRWLHAGVVPNTAFEPKQVAVKGTIPAATPTPSMASGTVDVVFRPDPSIYDGRFANNAWLQELPKSLTKLTWDNAALMSPATAERLGLGTIRSADDSPKRAQIVELRHGGRVVRAPAWIVPGHSPDTVTLHLGFGRTRAGRTANGIGFDANVLRGSSSPDVLSGVSVTRTGDSMEIACTQEHWSYEGRNIIRARTQEEFEKNPKFAVGMENQPLDRRITLYPERKWEGNQWGMTIDQNVCTGCNSCVVACQSENNIPVVGKSQVMVGREMHWLRVDRYYSGSIDNPDTYHQPMPCQQCEKAPCEVVCPVGATTHSDDGLNDMAYNRCVGTRYCSNNCPYKVRRFNFLLYGDFETPSLKLMRNPDVTVRSRGVMEKCTYCVQRIRQAEISAKLEDRAIRDGDIVTACQAACPTGAIVFGNINDPESRVSKQKASTLNYGLLEELNSRPRTTYMAVVWNPNTELDPKTTSEKEG